MDKIKKWLCEADIKGLLLSFFIPLVLLWLVFIALGVYPFGENSVLVLDLNGQYVYYFEGLRNIIKEGRSLLYTWNRALGGEFMGIFTYYLASPFSLIVALFPKKMITEALLCIELLKCGACGAAMNFYLHRSHPGKRTNRLIFATFYALSAYAIVYGHNTMWIDALIYLPLITLGLEQLITKKKFKLFAITLYLCVSSTFYIGYMVCIWVVLYFFYYYFSQSNKTSLNYYGEKAHFIRSLIRVGAISLIAVAMAAWIILPTYKSLTFGKTTFSEPDYAFDSKFTFFEFFGKFLLGSYDTVRPEGFPVVYCGMLTLLLVPLYFLCKIITAREKIFGGILAGILCFSMSSTTIDLIWHGMQRPNWLNYRYSFMLVFLLLVFAYRAFCNLDSIRYEIITASAALICILIFIVQALQYENTPDLTCIWISAGLVLIYLLALHPVKHGYLEQGGAMIVCVIICVECFAGALFNLNALDDDVHISSRTSYRNFIDQYTGIVNSVKEYDPTFYRMEKYNHRKTNDPFTLDFYGLSNSTSTLNAKQIDFLNYMGYCSKSHWSQYMGGTPVSDSLLGLKYIIYDKADPNELYELIDTDTDHSKYAYHNPYCLPIAYSVSNLINDITKFDITSYQSPFDMMNNMVASMLGKDEPIELFKKLECEESDTDNVSRSNIASHWKYAKLSEDETAEVTFSLTAETESMIYMFLPSEYPREVKIYVNGSPKDTFFGNETDRIVELGEYDKGQVLNVSLSLEKENLYISSDTDFYFAYLDDELFRKTFTELQKGGVNITEFSETRLYGTVDVPEDRTTLFATVPYDDGWVLKIDGEVTDYNISQSALISAKITPGEHTVEFEYKPKCFTYGLTISLCALALFIIVCVFEFYAKKRRKFKYLNRYYKDISPFTQSKG